MNKNLLILPPFPKTSEEKPKWKNPEAKEIRLGRETPFSSDPFIPIIDSGFLLNTPEQEAKRLYSPSSLTTPDKNLQWNFLDSLDSIRFDEDFEIPKIEFPEYQTDTRGLIPFSVPSSGSIALFFLSVLFFRRKR